MPAQFISTVAIPNFSFAMTIAFLADSSSATLYSIAIPAILSATFFAREMFISSRATFAPAASNALAVAAPRPEAPPVTMAEIFFNFHDYFLLLLHHLQHLLNIFSPTVRDAAV